MEFEKAHSKSFINGSGMNEQMNDFPLDWKVYS